MRRSDQKKPQWRVPLSELSPDLVRMSEEKERLKTQLALTRERCVQLTQENIRLRAALKLPPRAALPPSQAGPIIVPVHPDLLPPPPPKPPPAPAPAPKKKKPLPHYYSGDLPLRTQWPLET